MIRPRLDGFPGKSKTNLNRSLSSDAHRPKPDEERKKGLGGACWRPLVILLAFLQTYPLAATQNIPAAPLSPAAQKIKHQINAVRIGRKLTIQKNDGTEYHGRLETIENQTFSIREVDLKQLVAITVDDPHGPCQATH